MVKSKSSTTEAKERKKWADKTAVVTVPKEEQTADALPMLSKRLENMEQVREDKREVAKSLAQVLKNG